ncbi:hypothetical protein K450DRAFT_224366 [Umbelopsis ramanniana AG]|uniref:MHD domain-containing protein n=1 Tax=Umbelopsis ramanniana AG TaxID=1314678 RepID=A0AAD5EGS4_UMBRA|nr:uncharacterized protein K450DRAFT_224366 [Umbelopsis ramanniana AG]KAI8583132.1 hypothetical protein K450DRAFT_224366 [Umbelopsis ramanniana AG]
MTIELDQHSAAREHRQFAETFLTEKPKDGIDIVQQRLRKSQKLNEELAEYFKERALIEDQYAKSLVKLSKKIFISDKSALGTMLPLWSKLSDEITEVSSIHGQLAHRIAEEVEKPLRSVMYQDSDMAKIRHMEPAINKHAKEYDELQLKLQKHQKIAEKAGSGKKLEEANMKLRGYRQVVDELKQHWSQDGPAYFDCCQTIEEARFTAAKEMIQAFEKAQAEQLAKRVEYADSVMVAAISLETEVEINQFAAHFTTHLKKLTLSTTDVPPPSEPEPLDLPVNIQPAFLQEEPRARASDDAASVTTNGKNSVKEGAGKLKNALKSLRRRTQAGISRSNIDGTSSDHAAEWATLDMNHGNTMDISSDQENSYNDSNLSHSMISQPDEANDKQSSSVQALDNAAALNSFQPSATPSMTESWSTLGTLPPMPKVDAEGFSIPPPDRTPWTEVAGGSSLNEAEADENEDASSIMSTNRFRVDIMNETVKEDAEATHALTRVATLLKEKNSPAASKRLRGRRETLRINQFGNNIGNLQQFGGSSSSLEIANINKISSSPISAEFADTHLKAATTGPNSSFISPRLNPFDNQAPTDEKGTDNPFELDSHDTSISVASPNHHTDNASAEMPRVTVNIAETVHVLTRSGEVTKSVVTGEISLTYQRPTQTPSKPLCIKLINIDHIERLAPNPSYISSVDGHNGVFQLNVDMFSKVAGNPVVSLKYQIKMDGPSAASVAPLIVRPIWKLEDSKSMLLVKYNGSAQGLSIGEGNITLENVSFLASVDGGVTSAQSMPACVWSMERQKILWNLNNLSISANEEQEEKKLMAKFDTQSKGTPQAIAVKFTSPGISVSKVDIVQDDTETDEVAWVHIDAVHRQTSSGKYLAEP